MGTLGRRALCILSMLFFAQASPASSGNLPTDEQAPANLYSQSLIQTLDRELARTGDSYLLLDARSGVLLAGHWEDYEIPIPLGSLVKPFTALAYAETHDFAFPRYECKGQSSCWQIHPHGTLDIVSAISVSCNSYFRSLAEKVSAAQLFAVTREFGLESPGANVTAPTLVGLGEDWKISPIHMTRAYAELYQRRSQPGVREIIEGMSRSAQSGTGSAVGRDMKSSRALVKTGTAPSAHAVRATTDGFAVVLLPSQTSALVLLIRVHGVAGARAAQVAAQALRQAQE
jgi:cell division protein FtsI/penicillin-binding protein 2